MRLKYKNSDLVNYGQWIQPTLSGTFWCHWHQAKGLKELTDGRPLNPFILLDGHSLTFEKDKKVIRETLIKKIKNLELKQYIKNMDELGKNYEEEHLKILKLDKNYQTYLPKLFYTYQNLVGLWWFCIVLAEELGEYIKSNWPLVTNDQLFELTKPIRPTWLQLQNREIELLAKKVKIAFPNSSIRQINLKSLRSNRQLYQRLCDHTGRFVWFGTHHWMGKKYTINKAILQIKESLARSRIAPRTAEFRSVVPRNIIGLARIINYWRTHCAELTAKVVFLSRSTLNDLAKKWRLSYKNLIYLSHQEILSNLKSAKLPSRYYQIIKKRKVAYGCILDGEGNEQIYTGKKLKKILKNLVKIKYNSTNHLKGVVANIGAIVEAKAKIIMSPRDFKNFKKGDILVANETTPDFVPLMRLASAIITDLGGITSHAAIISRELDKPCIIATKYATKLIKNGDIVKVNTTDGTVNIK
jgi:phosphohistidine swiveling domain-containing protein